MAANRGEMVLVKPSHRLKAKPPSPMVGLVLEYKKFSVSYVQMLAKEKKRSPHPSKEKKGEKKKRAVALLGKIWSNRKRREIMDILNHPNPPTIKRLYFGGFLRYGVGLSVDEIMEICDAYASWEDYDRGLTRYYLMHIGKEGKAQREIRTSYREAERSKASRFFSPSKLPKDAKRIIEIENGAGFVTEWIKVEGKLG